MNWPPVWAAALCARLTLVLVHFVWQGAAVAILAAGAAAAMGRARASLRYGVWFAAMAALAVCPIVTFTAVGSVSRSAQPIDPAGSPAAQPAGSGEAVVRPAIGPPPAMPGAPAPDAGGSGGGPWARAAAWLRHAAAAAGPYLTAAYLLGVLLMLLRLTMGLLGSRRLLKASVPAEDADLLAAIDREVRAVGLAFVPAVALCRKIAAPTVLGVFRPTVLLPLSIASGLSPAQVEALLAHEIAHIRRWDHLVNFLQQIVEAVLFFHPAVWYVSRQVRRERENCCDDRVLATGREPAAYADSLLRMAQRSLTRRRAAAAGLEAASRPSELRRRISRMLGEPPRCCLRLSQGALAALGLGIAVSLVAVSYLFAQADRPRAVGNTVPIPSSARVPATAPAGPASADEAGRKTAAPATSGIRFLKRLFGSRRASRSRAAARPRSGPPTPAGAAAASFRLLGPAGAVAAASARPEYRLTPLPGMPVHSYGIPDLLAALKVSGGAPLSENQARAELLRRLKRQVAVASWAPKGKADVRLVRGSLLVRQTPKNHINILKWLNKLRRELCVHIQVDAAAFRMPAASDEAFRRWLRSEKLGEYRPAPGAAGVGLLLLPAERADGVRKRLSRGKSAQTVASPQFLTLNGQTTLVRIGREMPIPLRAGGDTSPRTLRLSSGLELGITPSARPGKGEISLAIQPSFSDLRPTRERVEQDLACADVTVRTTASQALLLRVAISRYQMEEAPAIDLGAGQTAPRIILRRIRMPAAKRSYVHFLLRARPVAYRGAAAATPMTVVVEGPVDAHEPAPTKPRPAAP